jgi:hypothetical protein
MLKVEIPKVDENVLLEKREVPDTVNAVSKNLVHKVVLHPLRPRMDFDLWFHASPLSQKIILTVEVFCPVLMCPPHHLKKIPTEGILTCVCLLPTI